MVPGKGLEPSRLTALVPKTSVSTNSTTRASSEFCYDFHLLNFIRKLQSPQILPLPKNFFDNFWGPFFLLCRNFTSASFFLQNEFAILFLI